MNYQELNERVISLMSRKDYTPSGLPEVALALKINKGDLPRLKKSLNLLLAESSIVRVKGNKFALPSDVGLISGIIEFKQNGSATIFANGKNYILNRENTATAYHKDKVLARIVHDDYYRGRRGDDKKFFAKVIRILECNTHTVIGTLRKTGSTWHLVPDDPKFYYDIIVANPAHAGLEETPQENDKVLVKLDPWIQRHLNPSGTILEDLGSAHTPMTEYKSILSRYNLSEEFPDNVLQELKKIPKKVSESECKNRLDLRGEFTITIDPADAKDFDDAISLRKLKGGVNEIGVHIADVAYYVNANSNLDKEAMKRGNSTYLVGTVIPMLPFELSNGICSLVEGQDRLVKSVFLSFDSKGDCVNVRFANSVIRSVKRLSYEQAHAFLTENNLEKIKEVKSPEEYETGFAGRSLSDCDEHFLLKLRSYIRSLWSVASQLRSRRFKKGSLDLEMPEVKIHCDKDGWASEITKVEHNESHQLIEEFMLAANEAIARQLKGAKIPFISRVHDEPDQEKLNELGDELETFGIITGDLTKRNEVMRLLSIINKHPQGYLLKTKFLRSLKRAVYRASPDGHYGLRKEYYAHFTSPIRRYADFTVHRNFNFYMQLDKMETAPKQKCKLISQKNLEDIADHISRTERNSTEAERDSKKVKLLEFFEAQADTKNSFEAMITQISSHGLFVELTESMAFGFVHAHNFKNDFYRMNNAGTAFVGRRTNKQYKVGDKVRVYVEHVDRFKRQIDFKI